MPFDIIYDFIMQQILYTIDTAMVKEVVAPILYIAMNETLFMWSANVMHLTAAHNIGKRCTCNHINVHDTIVSLGACTYTCVCCVCTCVGGWVGG